MTAAPRVSEPETALPAAVERIRAHHDRFLELLGQAERLAMVGRGEDALGGAQQAAGWAWLRHAGLHASPRLESLVRGLAPAGHPWRPRARRRSSVLHVLTQAYPTGGHTRWSDRIIRADRARSHSVLLTAQGRLPVPPWLRASVEASGGRLHLLADGPMGARAAAIARLAADVDLVLANIHPNDAAAVAGLAGPARRAPVATLNHADHAFWLGMSAADLLVGFRGAGEALAVRRRGADADRCAILPLPVDAPGRPALDDPRRSRIREAMGIGADEIVLLSAGSPWKFDPGHFRGEPSFPEVLAPIVAADPRLRLYVLGPRPDGEWAAAARATDARMRALGTRTDYTDYQLAADLYLDPFPFGSLYSLLEPGSLGIPGVGLAQWPSEAAVLMVDAPGLDGVHRVARGRDEYEALVRGLVDDEQARRDLGGRLRDGILRSHAGEAWLAAFDAIVERAPAAREAALASPRAPDATLDEPAMDLLARGLAWIPESVPPPSERVTLHLPVARA